MPQAQSVVDAITRCFDNDTYSDLTIKCRDRSWKVHRVIVCSQSKVLHAACMAGFKESHTGVIDLEDDDPAPVEIMLKYFYTSKYNELISETDKYDVPTLMGLAQKRFKSTLGEGPSAEQFLSAVPDATPYLHQPTPYAPSLSSMLE